MTDIIFNFFYWMIKLFFNKKRKLRVVIAIGKGKNHTDYNEFNLNLYLNTVKE